MKRALLAVALLVPIAAAQADPSEQVARRMRDLEKRLETAPGDGRAWLELGRMLERIGDLERAQQYLARARELGAEPGLALPALVRISLALEDYRAATHWGEALDATLRPGCGQAHHGAKRDEACRRLGETRVMLAELADAMGDATAARDLLEAAIRAHATQADAYATLAHLQRTRFGNRAAARAVLERGISALGTDPRAEPLQQALLQVTDEEDRP